MSRKALISFRANVHSQNGEDGVLAEIHRRLGIAVDDSYWCVEFGAWDGRHLSNTFSLVESYGAHAVYIEGDQEKFAALEATASVFTSIVPIQSFVVGSEKRSGSLVTPAFTGTFDTDSIAELDDILAKTSIPSDYELLSIDIDSFDLEVWEASERYQPKIVVIEINSSIPPGVLQWHGPGRLGNSFSSTLSVAARKGFTLVCHTGNMIFVRNDLVDNIGLTQLDRAFPERLFTYDWVATEKTRIGFFWRTLLSTLSRVKRVLTKGLRR